MACMRPFRRQFGGTVRFLSTTKTFGCRTIATAVLREDPTPDTFHHGNSQLWPHNAIAELRILFSRSSVLSNVTVLEILRRHFPQCTVTQTPKDTGLISLAKAGKAIATLDTASEFYASRTYELPDDEEGGKEGHLEHQIGLGRYDYQWNGHSFQIFALKFWESDNNPTRNHYIVYPRQPHDIRDGQSKIVDSLIEAAATHGLEVNEEIWVFDRGY